jgi:hypothetical protein
LVAVLIAGVICEGKRFFVSPAFLFATRLRSSWSA